MILLKDKARLEKLINEGRIDMKKIPRTKSGKVFETLEDNVDLLPRRYLEKQLLAS